MQEQPEETIELLSVALLDRHRTRVKALKSLAHSLDLEFGWHYLLDLTWILGRLGSVKGKGILDAGAGTGILQWYLAQEGAEVTSVDRVSRANLPLRFRSRFKVKGFRKQDLLPSQMVFKSNFSGKEKWPVKWGHQVRDVAGLADPRREQGKVLIYNQDLKNLCDIPTDSLDAVVAVSALEHNPPEDLPLVVAELMRVLKPGGLLLASLNAARDEDWWHAPSSGWCYTSESLRRLFDLPPETPSNYECYDEFFAALRNCAELRNGLARFYFRSDKNGMPWGKWDPQYIPVGVCKRKRPSV
jgi:SAM-dependent methyltransferase